MAVSSLVRAAGATAAVALAVALGFFSTLYLLEPQGAREAPSGVAVEEKGVTRCELELGPERCPGLPGFEPAKLSRTFNDSWDGAGTNMDRCLQRAAEFRSACKGQGPVTARFMRGDQVVRARTQP